MSQSVVIGLLCSDWSDGPVCCDWSTLLWLVYSALIGQMAQSVVIGLLCSDWSDVSVCCDWSTLFWLVYSALIGQMSQSVVIGLLCSDWSNVSVCCDWSTLLQCLRAGQSKCCLQALCKFVTKQHRFVQEVRLESLTTRFRQFRIGSFFQDTITPFICTLIFETLQTFYIQLHYLKLISENAL